MTLSSRIPGFYKLSLADRRKKLCELTELSLEELADTFDTGGLSPCGADKVVENVLGVYSLPIGVAVNIKLNNVDHLAPMVVEEPSVIAAASNAARMIRAGGGFHARKLETLMTTQIEVYDVSSTDAACQRLQSCADVLLELANDAVPGLNKRGGGARELEARDIGSGMLVVHIHVDCQDAMGANLVNTISEAVGPEIARIAGGKLGLQILTNLSDRRRVQISAAIPIEQLVPSQSQDDERSETSGASVARSIEQASRFAEADAYRAATHNKGIMNGVDSVVIATGNDYRAVEAGAHAFAARSGQYRPLATWRLLGAELHGTLDMPLALGIVGGALRVHAGAQLALRLCGVSSATHLAQLAGAVGLASNLAALRALATEGIQRGHMALHARSIASAAGAVDAEVEKVAAVIASKRTIDLASARAELARQRSA